MREIVEISRAISQAAAEPTWLATVVGIEGSAYRRPGARMLFGRDRKLVGTVSGGCLEREIVRTGAWLARDGAVLRTYDTRSDEDGPGAFSSGCNGKVELLIEPVTDELRAALEASTLELLHERSPTLVTMLDAGGRSTRLGTRLLQTDTGVASFGGESCPPREFMRELAAFGRAAGSRIVRKQWAGLQALIEPLEPEPHVSVFGTGEDAVPVVQLAARMGWGVSVRAKHAGFAARDRFAGTAHVHVGRVDANVSELSRYARSFVVVMTHEYDQDRETLGALLSSSVRYIGMLGPRRRTQRMLTELAVSDADPRLANLYGPAGLHLGADTPETIALSIVAEMQAVLAQAEAGFLRQRALGIHTQSPALRLLRAEGA